MMKFRTLLVSALVVLFSFSLYAQEKEMTSEEWEAEIKRLNEKKVSLQTEMTQLKEEVAKLKSEYEALGDPEQCKQELFAIINADQKQIMQFGKQVDMLERKVDARSGDKEDLVAELKDLQNNPISACPAYFDKVHNQLQRKLDAWNPKPKEILYTVVKGDCLWNIAKKKEIYDNGFAWPKIYHANKDQIKDPNLIYPKQVFKIPNLTEEEKAKYDKLRRNYKPAPTR